MADLSIPLPKAPSAAAASGAIEGSALLKACVSILIVAGIAGRLSPLFDVDQRLLWQYMSEDGYLMQAIARNMAIGLGMSTSAGTIATNGVQPLATFFYAALHFFAGGSKPLAIAFVTVFSTAVSAAGAYALYLMVRRLLASWDVGTDVAIVSAALWFAGPHIVKHSMNGLETGVYYLAITVLLAHYLGLIADTRRAFGWRQRLSLGGLLGIAFLARNDAVFLIAGLLLAHFIVGGPGVGGGYRHRLVDVVVAGLTTTVIALPWLVNNYVRFGSVVPISGTAQSHGAKLGANLPLIPANLLESMLVFLPIPRSLEENRWVLLASLILLLVVALVYLRTFKSMSLAIQRHLLIGAIFCGCICGYYGLFFGAAHFVARYTSPLAIFLWPAAVAVLFHLARTRLPTRALVSAMGVGVAVLSASAVTLLVRDFVNGRQHMHRQVVDWVQAHVPPTSWVGAVQTGTLGYFHDRTINLDGKVNPAALKAALAQGQVLSYVVDKPEIEYLADWAGITTWMVQPGEPRFAKTFRVIVNDEAKNLGVLQRIHPNP